ncbi:MAG TPA: hypothetical protein VK501_09530 [Baekduia sp.]|uniref:hypothetical protein n=1 Tax=Baekduia sp. TaxID=2600305 RepID=UPI002B9B2AF2|nr:hypothetical protein [Baekduia sp.]HMJ34148.1 hypothetical protein [Baekduia sp.]
MTSGDDPTTLAATMPLPPLLSDRPRALRLTLTYVTPAVGGLLAGATLGLSLAAWTIANVLATLGGLGGGFEHDTLRDAARRGAIGGLLFGTGLVVADATVVDDRVATIVDPAFLHPLLTTTVGTLLSVAGAALRLRVVRRREAAAAAA